MIFRQTRIILFLIIVLSGTSCEYVEEFTGGKTQKTEDVTNANLNNSVKIVPKASDKRSSSTSPFELEPNNHYGNADQITIPFTGSGILESDDVDWYVFTLEKEAKILIERVKVEGKNPDIKLYLHSARLGEIHFSPKKIEKTLKPETYYIRIMSYDNATGGYGLKISADGIKQPPMTKLNSKVKNPCPKKSELWGFPPPKGYKQWCGTIAIGRYHGPYTEWYEETGNKSITGEFNNGKRFGKETSWWENGEIKEICHYGDSGIFDCVKCKSSKNPRGKKCD